MKNCLENNTEPPVTTAQALATYKREVKDNTISEWPNWIIAVHNSVACREWIGGGVYPAYAKEVFNILMSEETISYSDSN
jgi:hypothetical protein